MSLAPILASSAAIQFHLAAAVLALGLGSAVLVMRKGTLAHRWIGWAWIGVMLAVALSSFAITSIWPGHYSPIHILSIITLISLPAAVWLRRRGQIKAHAITMVSTFSGLLIAGVFTLAPGRLLHAAIFGL
ncbi:DUF2306 domain-containing protein [Methyloferula stellata]|uniref:DUF2306 domain-containing protein n=1 Tax=Methyloferula stellata TaxID=876270 RepID=UPI00037CAE1C|nr:hypothetical protein [Methyloferula stellata]